MAGYPSAAVAALGGAAVVLLGIGEAIGAQQSSLSPRQSSRLSLPAVAATTSAAMGSRIPSPAEAPINAIRAAAAWAAHMRFCIPSPAVALEPSRSPRRSLAHPNPGMSTIADAVTAIPSVLVVVSLPTISRWIAS
jgi:hypothetical protein